MKLFLILLFLIPQAQAARKPGPKNSRTVMVQLFEWPWDSIATECEQVLGPAGFSAVQVSPPTEHVSIPESPWWERYQPASHRLITRSGTERQFADMVRRCSAAGVDVYADVVLNHMAGRADGVGFAKSRFAHYEYPGLFSHDDFHHCGRNGNDDIVDFTDLYELQHCELLNLADLNTESPAVQHKLSALLRKLISLGVAGFRIDAAKHMPARDISAIFSQVRAPFYAVHELIISPGEPVNPGPYLPLGDLNVFPYAYGVGQAFKNGDLRSLPDLPSRLGVNSSDAVVFLENHDLERRPPEETVIPFVKEPELHRLALVFLLTYPYGYPQLYSGYHYQSYDQGPPLKRDGFTASPAGPAGKGGSCVAPWTCAHRDPKTLALVNFRNRTDSAFYASDISRPRVGVLSYGRGSLGHVVINASLREEFIDVKTQLSPGRHCSVLDEASCAVVDGQGNLKLRLPAKSAFVAL